MNTAQSSQPKPAAPGRDPRIQNIESMIRARYSVIHIPSPEEGRVLDVLSNIIRMRRAGVKSLFRWSVTEGLVEHGRGARTDEQTQAPEEALRRVLDWKDDGSVFVFRDLHHYFEHPTIVRLLRDCAQRLRGAYNTMVLLSPTMALPGDLEKDVAVADFPLPSPAELAHLVDRGYEQFQGVTGSFRDEWTPELRNDVIRACSGLTEHEADDALAKAIIEADGMTPAIIDSLNRTKREAIRRTRCLEAIDAAEGMDSVGGLDVLKAWVRKRQRTFSDEARAFGVEAPKGMLTLGVPGGGKGLSAKAVANLWRVPLLRLDMGAVFGGIVGESESNLRSALRIAEAVAPVVLWVDEIEKGLAGVGSSDRSDGGTTARVFGTLLTWLQEKVAPVFCYFTANDISSLPPELLRKGRIDEIFFIDLPTPAEREEILAIHLRKRGREPAHFRLPLLSQECDGFVGAEIEQGVREALIEAFSLGRTMQDSDIINAFAGTVPMVRTQRDKIVRLMRFAEEGRAVRASSGPRVRLDPSPDMPDLGRLGSLGS